MHIRRWVYLIGWGACCVIADLPTQVQAQQRLDESVWQRSIAGRTYPAPNPKEVTQWVDEEPISAHSGGDERSTRRSTSSSFSLLKGLSPVWNVIVYALAVLALAGLLYWLVVYLLQLRKTTEDTVPAEQPVAEALDTNLLEHEFAPPLTQALLQHDYRLALRLYYLTCLQRLHAAGCIHWQPAKTNAAYVAEVATHCTPHYAMLWQQATRLYESTWYGEHEPTLSDFKTAQIGFDSLLQPSSYRLS